VGGGVGRAHHGAAGAGVAGRLAAGHRPGPADPQARYYVIPDGLSTLHIDRDADLGTYTEPNMWMQHR
jgi:hypothetical protein